MDDGLCREAGRTATSRPFASRLANRLVRIKKHARRDLPGTAGAKHTRRDPGRSRTPLRRTRQQAADGLNRRLPDLPDQVRTGRGDMVRILVVHMCAQKERELADGMTGAGWEATTTRLVDAVVGMLLAPVTQR